MIGHLLSDAVIAHQAQDEKAGEHEIGEAEEENCPLPLFLKIETVRLL